ncbi:MAG: hypothetical protein F6J86_22740 [Symploca sp. SIO1B1]|nr:hypothetical protein [Symploca sp. SIO1A3]NER96625.1 hypothetical protein [Symploca sp. SIO1B1]
MQEKLPQEVFRAKVILWFADSELLDTPHG